jgi:hypothetical protein
MTPQYQKRYCEQYGSFIFDGEWKFKRKPDKECPVVEMTGLSLWLLVSSVYNAIIDYK